MMMDTPLWLVDPAPRVSLWGAFHEVDITADTPEDIVRRMQPGVRWVSVAEPPAHLDDRSPRIASVSVDGTRVGAALTLLDGGGSSTARVRPSSGPRATSVLGRPRRPREGASAARQFRRGAERAGGCVVRPSEAPTAAPSAAIFGRIRSMPCGGSDPHRGPDAGKGARGDVPPERAKPLRARRADDRKQDARALGPDRSRNAVQHRARRLETADEVRSGLLDDGSRRGELLCTGSSAKTGEHTGVVVANHDLAPLRVQHVFKGKGELAFEPTLTEQGLTLPVRQGSIIENRFQATFEKLGHDSFAECM